MSPGSYAAVDFQPGDLQGGITLLADVTGALTVTAPGEVTIDARGRSAAIVVSGQDGLTIDGFTLRGGKDAGVLVTDSSGTTVRNCSLKRNTGDGVRLERSDGGLIFDNLITSNGGAGIRVLASGGVRVINNTVYKNTLNGLAFDNAAADVEVKNNIFDHNTPAGIVVASSTSDYRADFNLNNDGYQGTPPGFADIVGANPLFIFPSGDDFHLQAFEAGTTSPAINAGDPDTDGGLVDVLVERSVQVDGAGDSPPVDLGFHYSTPPPTPTPKPRATRTFTPRLTGTPPTPTRTHTAGGVTSTPTPTATDTPGGRSTRVPRPTRVPRA